LKGCCFRRLRTKERRDQNPESEEPLHMTSIE
jgi:hypothetical protein